MDKREEMLVVDAFIEHLMHPCEVEVEGRIHNIRGFYIREAQKVLDDKILKSPAQRERLEDALRLASLFVSHGQ